MLVHDAKADKAAASLDVAVGHLYDPTTCRALLTSASIYCLWERSNIPEKTSTLNFWRKTMAAPTLTGASNTNYFFSVSTTALSGALSRFAGFFHCPLFAPSCTSRELNAVDSEHKKNLQNDMWRIFQVNKHLTKEGHPWQKFGSGIGRVSRSSLAPSPTSSRVPSPAPKQDAALRPRNGIPGRTCGHGCFTVLAIPNRGQEPLPMIHDHPFRTKRDGHPVQTRKLLSNFIGHEGPGSLHSYLKHKGWISLELWAATSGQKLWHAEDYATLTPEGFENYRSVMLSVFKYLSLFVRRPFHRGINER
ncbi:A-factor-processing enzyme [Grifola frondosa]|uniref:A-factor-processing enzyme n=1 Tax=Grifola frondosa TaxID=5627 RepID=A0A1C7LXF7_GRIFR|nr:A-factor-processing enzyme [Grifola frondosa]